MWIFYFAALPHVELAIAAAAYYTLPLFITLGAAIWLGDRIRPRGWFAVCLGFAGTLLILQPQADDFNAHALLPLVSAICYAAAMILTRSKCRGENPVILSLWLNFCFIGVGALALLVLTAWPLDPATANRNGFLLGDWTPMQLAEWRVMGMLALMIVIGSIFAAIAYQKGPSATVATFDFAYVGLAAIWGFVLFGEIPEPWIVVGILMIVSAGIVAVRKPS
jgi:drug/metabolite transporter (DMT)-like permease